MLLAQLNEPELSTLFTTLLTIWLFAVGASVGSFLNVVIYRMPAGLSIAHPPSHCPNCQHLIRRQDNIPIYSWLALRGKCHYCKHPISIRYLLIELLVAISFIVVALFEATCNGLNLPGNRGQYSSFEPAIWVIYSNQVIFLSTLWCIALIEYDQQRVPKRLVLPCFLMTAISMTIIADFYPHPSGIEFQLPWQLNNLLTGILGATTGALVGWQLETLLHATKTKGARSSGCILAAALGGWVLGWQAIIALLVITGLFISMGICVRVLTRGSLTITSDKSLTIPAWSPLAFPATCWLLIVAPLIIITWKSWAGWLGL